MTINFSELILAPLVYIFLQFLNYVSSSKIYYVLFSVLYLDFLFLLQYEILLKAGQEEVLLYMPYIVLLALYTIAVFEINGWKNLLDYIYETVTGHTYHSINIRSLFFLWPFFAKALSKYKDKKIDSNELVVAIIILVLTIIKEILKKNYILILILIYQYNSTFIFWLWFNHLFLILILISLLPIDSKAVLFINEFFGPSCIGWFGSYQTLKVGKTKLRFWLPSELVANNDKKS